MKNVAKCSSVSLISWDNRTLQNGFCLHARDYGGILLVNPDGSTRYFLRQFAGDTELVDVTRYVGDRNPIRVAA